MENSGWIINNLDSKLLIPLSRQNDLNKTRYLFKTTKPGKVTIDFIRYDFEKNEYQNKKFHISIKQNLINIADDKKKSEKKIDTIEKDYKRKLADNLYISGNYLEALKVYEEIQKQGKVDSELYYRMGDSAYKTGAIDKAIKYFQENTLDTSNPYFDETAIAYVEALKKQNKYEQAIDFIYKVGLSSINEEPYLEQLYLFLGDLQFNIKNYQEAQRAYRNFLLQYEKSNATDKALFYLGYSLEISELPDYQEASLIYKKLLDDFPDSQYVNIARSRLLFLERHHLKVN